MVAKLTENFEKLECKSDLPRPLLLQSTQHIQTPPITPYQKLPTHYANGLLSITGRDNLLTMEKIEELFKQHESIQKLSINGCKLSEGCLKLLSQKDLRALSLEKCIVSEQEVLPVMPHLEELECYQMPCSDEQMQAIGAQPKLQSLTLGYCAIHDERSLLPLCTLMLKSVTIQSKDRLMEQAVLHFFEKTKSPLEYVRLTTPSSNKTCELLSRFRALTTLHLEQCEEMDSASMQSLAKLQKLNSLHLKGAKKITNDAIKPLQPLQALEELDLYNCTQITDNIFQVATQFPQLSYLNVSGCNITDDGLPFAGKLTSLERLVLNYCNKLTGKNIGSLKSLSKLWLLHFGSQKFDTRNVFSFLALPALRYLNIDSSLDDATIDRVQKEKKEGLELVWRNSEKNATVLDS